MLKLEKSNRIQREGPVVFIIMDGMGIGKNDKSDAFYNAYTPFLDELIDTCKYRTLKAHGKAVGLPTDFDMGNSEVGHNALGAGKIYDQGAKLVSNAIATGKIFKSKTWGKILNRPLSGSTLHLIGLLSDGNVHSHIDHLFKIIEKAAEKGVKNLKVHILLDGRDVLEKSAIIYLEQLETVLNKYTLKGLDYRVASGGGRMVTTMDRYKADWNIVKRGWEAHVLGEARPFKSAREAIETFRGEDSNITDQFLPSFTIVDDKGPVGPILDADSVIFFNFRGDRSIEISRAFDEENFTAFERKRYPKVFYAGMMEYDGDLKIPANYLVYPPDIEKTISEYLSDNNVTQYAISETQKYGHVTYFWNGNRTDKFNEKLETYCEIPSDKIDFAQRPWMKAAEITDNVIKEIENGKFKFLRLNYANGDMVGHTGNYDAAMISAEAVDLCLRRLLNTVKKYNGVAIITADHGNLDQMYEFDKKKGGFKMDENTGEPLKKTSHTKNPVPFIIYDPCFDNGYELAELEDAGLGNMAATLLLFLGFAPPEDYLPPLIKLLDN